MKILLGKKAFINAQSSSFHVIDATIIKFQNLSIKKLRTLWKGSKINCSSLSLCSTDLFGKKIDEVNLKIWVRQTFYVLIGQKD